MADIISSDSTLTPTQRATLTAALNQLIPADTALGMPAAGDLDFLGYVSEFAADRLEHIRGELDLIDDASASRHATTFAELEPDDQLALLESLEKSQPYFAINLQVQALSCYYQDDAVVTALGMEARPPFPEGNQVVRGDLTLLDPVRQRGQVYRNA